MKYIATFAILAVGTGALEMGCKSGTDAPVVSTTASAVSGAQDSHCTEVVEVSQAACHAPRVEQDAGAEGDGGTPQSDYGATMFNAEGDDDDCKYHVKWSSAPASDGIHFTVTVTTKKDGHPLTGAPIDVEAFLDDVTPVPNTNATTKETSPGTYTIGPFAFSKSGRWTVRFHIHDECNDSETSPHGHAAFFVQVDVK